MSRLLIGLLIAVIALPLLLVAVLAIFLANPDSYREQITTIVADATGYQVTLGEMGWRYWPPIALELGDVAVATDAGQVAALRRVSLDLDLLPLLTGSRTLTVSVLEVDGVSVTARVAEDGSANWEASAPAGQSADETPTATPGQTTPATSDTAASDESVQFEINGLAITDVNIDYQDAATGAYYKVHLDSFASNRVAFDEPVELALEATVEDIPGAMTLVTGIAGTVTADAAMSRFEVAGLEATNRINLPDLPELTVDLQLTGMADLESDTARFETLSVTLPGLALQLSVAVSNMTAENPSLEGELSTNTFNPRALMQQLGLEEVPMADDQALTRMQFQTSFNGTPAAMELGSLDLVMDDSKLTGNATVAPGDITNVRFDLAMDSIVVDGYMAPDTSDDAASGPGGNASGQSSAGNAGSVIADSEVIPVATLADYEVDGRFTIGEVSYDTYTFNDFSVAITNAKRQLEAVVSLAGYDGTIRNVTSTNYTNEAVTRNRLTVTGMNLTTLTEMEALTGHVTMTADHKLRGQLLSQVMASIDGAAEFQVVDGTLDVTAIKRIAGAVDTLRGKTSEISQWPDQMPFRELNGKHTFSDGTTAGQALNFTVENMVVTGSGGFDYFANTLAYDLTANLRRTEDGAFKVGHALANIEWPVHCEGSMDDGPAELCFPDANAVQQLVSNVVRQEVERKGTKELNKLIDDKAPEELKGVLKGLFSR